MAEKITLFKKTGGDFIDPEDTGSYIRYKTFVALKKGKTEDKDYINTDFSMSLGDCNRVITWDFEDYDYDEDQYNTFKIEKIDAAIQILLQAKEDLIKAAKIAKKEKLRIQKAKSKVKKETKDGD